MIDRKCTHEGCEKRPPYTDWTTCEEHNRSSPMPSQEEHVDDALHLLSATRAILGCTDPASDIVADAECVRQLAINFRGALSRLLESPNSEARRSEAQGVLEGREYDPADSVAADSNESQTPDPLLAADAGKGSLRSSCVAPRCDGVRYCAKHATEDGAIAPTEVVIHLAEYDSLLKVVDAARDVLLLARNTDFADAGVPSRTLRTLRDAIHTLPPRPHEETDE